jgi:hypothetical protein
MNTSAIAVQQILPRTGARWKARNSAPNPPADADGDESPPQPEDGSPPAPASRTGHILDTVA